MNKYHSVVVVAVFKGGKQVRYFIIFYQYRNYDSSNGVGYTTCQSESYPNHKVLNELLSEHQDVEVYILTNIVELSEQDMIDFTRDEEEEKRKEENWKNTFFGR